MYTNSAPIPILTWIPHWIHSFLVGLGLKSTVPGCVTSSHIDLFCRCAILFISQNSRGLWRSGHCWGEWLQLEYTCTCCLLPCFLSFFLSFRISQSSCTLTQPLPSSLDSQFPYGIGLNPTVSGCVTTSHFDLFLHTYMCTNLATILTCLPR